METNYTITNLTKGLVYRLRYRVLNYVGWSGFSPTLFALVATVPSVPLSPDLISATNFSITLKFHESLNNGGSKVMGYELWMDNGFGTTFTKVLSYFDNSMLFTISSGLVSGRIYTFKYRSQNIIGFSDFSI